jgi:predicted nucleic acid-binding protein
MSLLLDTGIVYAYYDRSDDWHARARRLIQGEQRGLILPSPIIPEVDHLLGLRLGPKSRQVFYSGIVEGHYLVAELSREGYARVADLNRRFDDLDLGFVDAAIVAIAERLDLKRVATTDRRHFEPLARTLSLELVP